MLTLRATALSLVVALGFITACGDDSSACPDGSDEACAPVTCSGAGLQVCGSACVSTQSDAQHCGACGNACATGQACKSGVCVALCQIGGQQVAAGTVSAANSCEQCTPATSSTAWTQRADGTTCNPGQVCSAGACTPKCFIDGALRDSGAPNPANACETCAPATSTTAWTPRASVPLLVGGSDIAAQGWTTVAQGPNTLTYGADYARLATSTNTGTSTGGQLLITRPSSLDPTKPFKLRVTMQVESVSTHNLLDSGAAILGSFTSPFGNGTDRSQMLYLDSAAIGWSDDTQSAPFPVTDGAYHVYELAVDAAKVATVSVDGVAKLTRNNFTASGTIAIGDQTNDPNVDGAMRIKSVERACP